MKHEFQLFIQLVQQLSCFQQLQIHSSFTSFEGGAKTALLPKSLFQLFIHLLQQLAGCQKSQAQPNLSPEVKAGLVLTTELQ